MGVGDVVDRHDYQAHPEAPEPDGARALVLGEFGGVGWPVEGHLWNPDMRNWGYQTFGEQNAAENAYRELMAAVATLRNDAQLAGAIYTQTSDVEGEVNGLLTYDRDVEKFSASWLADVHAAVTGITRES